MDNFTMEMAREQVNEKVTYMDEPQMTMWNFKRNPEKIREQCEAQETTRLSVT